MTREKAIEIFQQYLHDIEPSSLSDLKDAVQIALADMKVAQFCEGEYKS